MVPVNELWGVLAWQVAAINAGGLPRQDVRGLTAPPSATSPIPQLRPQSSLISARTTVAAAQTSTPALAAAQIAASAPEQLASEQVPTKMPHARSKQMPAPVAVNTPDSPYSSPALSLVEGEGPPHHGIQDLSDY